MSGPEIDRGPDPERGMGDALPPEGAPSSAAVFAEVPAELGSVADTEQAPDTSTESPPAES